MLGKLTMMKGAASASKSAMLAVLGFLLAFPLASAGAAGQERGPAPDPRAAAVAGKITRETTAVAGARVYAYSGFEDFVALRSAAASAAAGVDGAYRLVLPAGTYYLVARGNEDPSDRPPPVGGLFSFHGSNPFTLAPGSQTEVNFSLAKKLSEPLSVPGAEPASGALAGVVRWEGRPMAGVQVRLYLDSETAFRGMGYALASPTDDGGSFRFDFLPESAYYVIARKRAGGAGPGPLDEGDFYGYFVDNPVRIRSGTVVTIALELVNKGRDTGNADGRPRPSGTSIVGRITDASGTVVRGVYAFAYEEKVMAHKKPAFISQPVDQDGRYVINLSRGGTFFVGARSGYGDSPRRGEWYGRYEGAPDHGVTVAAGASATGIDIRVERILP